jgi:hypothetical protein
VIEPASYVIRIYRRDAEAFAGLVEDVRAGRAAPFRTLAELCELLSGRKPFPRRSRRTARGQATPAT